MVTEAQFYLPREKERMIQRAHLLEKLYHGLDYKIALITAMTGNGKSTLLTQWAKKIQCPVCYLSLERQVNRMSTFWQQVIYSLYSIFPNIEKEFVKEVMAENEMSVDFIPKLTHYLQTHQGQVVLIWDDFHFITNEQLLDSVDYFIKLLPANVHLLMASQTRPRISLSTLRLKGELYELEEQSLRFTKEEISELIYKTISVELSGNLVEWIQYRTEGWIAGIRIYTLLLERYKEQNISLEAELLESITGGHAYIAGYFVEGIFNKIPPEKQLYLLQTSVLKKINIPLIEAVTGQDHGHTFLNYVERENLFLIPLDYKNEWFRYHHLFREFLEMELLTHYPDMYKEVHFQAGVWLEAKGAMLEAIDHFLASETYELALRLLKRMIPTLLHDKQSSLAKRLHRIPNHLLFTYPKLYLANAASLYITGYKDEATASYWWATERLEEPTTRLTKTEIQEFKAGLDFLVVFRSFIEKDFSSFLIYSKKYLEVVPEGDLFINFGSDKDGHHLVWDVFVSDEYTEESGVLLQEALHLWGKSVNRPFQAHLSMDYARLLYEKNNVEEAQQYAKKVLSIGEDYKITSLIVGSKLLMAKIAFAKGFSERAFQILTRMEQRIHPKAYSLLIARIRLYRDLLRIKTGEFKQGGDDKAYEGLKTTDELSPVLFERYYIFVHLLYQQGEAFEASKLLQRLMEVTENDSYCKDDVRCRLFQSYVLYDQKQFIESYKTLESALMIAESKRYIRTILDEGPCIDKLLQHYIVSVQENHITHVNRKSFDYAKLLMEHFILEADTDKRKKDGLPQKVLLTNKEQTVLFCIDEGFSNREIALELHVSLSTVKTHINHLYRKLNVNNRVLAIQRARELELL